MNVTDKWFDENTALLIRYMGRVKELEEENSKLHQAFEDHSMIIAELEDANRWIPVSECNPKYSNWYDVLRYDKTIKQLCQLDGYYFSSESRWQEPMYGENEPVLFWRENLPLPTLPEVEG